jgi:hypothetical protein
MTAQSNELIIVIVTSGHYGWTFPSSFTSHYRSRFTQNFTVTDSLGTAFMQRGTTVGIGRDSEQISEFYTTTGSHTGSFTVTAIDSHKYDGEIDVSAFGILGANITSPFDSHAGLPYSSSSMRSSVPSVAGVSTSNANDLILGFEGQLSKTPETQGSFFTGTILNNAKGEGNNIGYATVTLPLSDKTISFGTCVNHSVMIVDAVKQACSVSVTPTSVTLDAGQSQTFMATVYGGNSLSYQWYLDGSSVPGATSSSYSYTASGTSHSLYITATDSINGHFTSNAASIKVNPDPTVTVSPSSSTMDAGQSQTFTAAVTGGTAPFSYQWYLDGNPVGTNSTSYTYLATASEEPSVTIYAAVTDSASTPITVNSTTLTVAVNPLPTVTISPDSWTLSLGQSETFTANPVGGSGTYTSYQWYVNGSAQNGQTSSTFSYSTGSLGSATITVTVTDSAGITSAQSPPASVAVNDVAPSITAPSNVTVDANTLGGATNVNLGTPIVSTSTYQSSQLTITNNASALFPIGSTTVSWTVTDPSGLCTTANQVVTVNAGAATHFVISAPSSATAGTAFSITVKTYDALGNVATGYSGTIHFTSTSPGTLPADSALTNGAGAFTVTLTSAGSQTITATDTANGSISGTSGPIAVSATSMDHVTINPSSSTIIAGGSQAYSVTAYDVYGNSLGDVTSATTFTAPGASVSGNSVSAANAGSYIVTASYEGKTATANLLVHAADTPKATTYTVTFTENGLPQGQVWNVTFNGLTESSSTNTTVFSNVAAGTYSWATSTIANGASTRYLAFQASGTISIPTQTTITVTYTTQYYLTVNSAYGKPAGAGWYNAGATASFSVTSPFTGALGIQYVFKSWTGTGAGSYTGSGTTQTATMNNPITETATWTLSPTTSLYIVGIVAIILFAAAFTAFSLLNWRKRKKAEANSTPTPKA